MLKVELILMIELILKMKMKISHGAGQIRINEYYLKQRIVILNIILILFISHACVKLVGEIHKQWFHIPKLHEINMYMIIKISRCRLHGLQFKCLNKKADLLA